MASSFGTWEEPFEIRVGHPSADRSETSCPAGKPIGCAGKRRPGLAQATAAPATARMINARLIVQPPELSVCGTAAINAPRIAFHGQRSKRLKSYSPTVPLVASINASGS
jgi:hypothetical protein